MLSSEENGNLLQFDEYCDKLLLRYDMEELVDVLEISGEDIIERFKDKIIVLYKDG